MHSVIKWLPTAVFATYFGWNQIPFEDFWPTALAFIIATALVNTSEDMRNELSKRDK